MKRIIVFFIFVPYFIFAQENIDFGLYNDFSYSDESNYIDTNDKIKNSLLPFFVLVGSVGLNIGMREGIYRNNYQDNWWGTVNGVLTLGLAGTLIGTGISYGIYKITNERFDKMNILWGTFLGLAGGVTMAFFYPFNQVFRENAILYYSYPALFAAGLTFVIIDIWFGEGNTQRNQISNALMKFHFK